jgi:hypothetical protein
MISLPTDLVTISVGLVTQNGTCWGFDGVAIELHICAAPCLQVLAAVKPVVCGTRTESRGSAFAVMIKRLSPGYQASTASEAVCRIEQTVTVLTYVTDL